MGGWESPKVDRHARTSNERDWRAWMRGFGATVRRARDLAGLTQGELADRAHISQGGVSRLEGGRGTAVPLRSVMSVLGVLAESLRSMPPGSVPDDVLWLIGVPQLAPWSSPTDTQPSAGDPLLNALVERHRAMTPAERVVFVHAALSLADALQLPGESSDRGVAKGSRST